MKLLIKLLILTSFLTLYSVFGQSNKKVYLTIKNSSGWDRKEVITIPWQNILAKYPGIDTANFKIINEAKKSELVFQLEHLGKSEIQNLLIQVDVKAYNAQKLSIQKGKPLVFPSKTYARYVPERKDDFAWENDKIAFRMYGKALEETKENAYGIDVWVKSTQRLVLNERYKRGQYHIDHGDGLDYYHVGFTLGAGNMAPYINDTIRYSKNYIQWKVLDNGPLRTTFQLDFAEWDIPGDKVILSRIISLDAGSQLNKVTSIYSFSSEKPMPVVAGIIKRKDAGKIMLDEQAGIMSYWEPQNNKNGITAVGCIFPAPIKMMKINKEQLLTETEVNNSSPFIYYTGAAWDKAGVILHAEDWQKYLIHFKKNIETPLLVIFE